MDKTQPLLTSFCLKPKQVPGEGPQSRLSSFMPYLNQAGVKYYNLSTIVWSANTYCERGKKDIASIVFYESIFYKRVIVRLITRSIMYWR